MSLSSFPIKLEKNSDRVQTRMKTIERSDELDRILGWFKTYESCLVAFSAGVDSSLLAYCAKRALGDRAFAVTSLSPSFAEEEKRVARDIAAEIGIKLFTVEQKDLQSEGYVSNGVRRCYYCRGNLANAIQPLAKSLAISVCVDGTHLDDMNEPRPGIKALRQAGFRAPYVELGLRKEIVRNVARRVGLSNWNHPSEACLSSRIAFGQRIDLETLRRIEVAENAVKFLTGAKIVRVRTKGKNASVEVDKQSLDAAFAKKDAIVTRLRNLGYHGVEIDPTGYASGKMLELYVKDNS